MTMTRPVRAAGALLAGLSLPAVASAAPQTLNGANTAWVLTATTLVLFMTIPGLALFYAGLVRSKNVLSVLMQCFAITCVISLLWLAFAYSLCFRSGGSFNALLGGMDRFFFLGMTVDSLQGDIPETVYAMFQMTFAFITPALIVGGFAERMRFTAMLWFSVLWFIVVYVPICHRVWGGGWLGALGVMDFAGGTVVHINAGVASLVAALVLSKRRGFPDTPMPPHNMTMTVTGAAMLWVGWFGFNAGSALAANGNAGMAMLVTHLGAAAGSLAWMFSEWRRYGKPSVLGIVTGMVAGLGTITPASGFVGPIGAVVIGGVAGVVCFWATHVMKRRLHVDDALDVFPVHGVGGVLGTLLTGVFAATSLGGLGMHAATIGGQVAIQFVGVVVTAAWCGVWSWVILKVLDRVLRLRVSAEEETEGLDLVLHEEKGYNL